MQHFLSNKIFSSKAWLVLLSLPFLFSCASYNNKLSRYYGFLKHNNYSDAQNALNNNRFLKQNRNELLRLMELGKLHHLQGSYDSSNIYLNQADAFIESQRKSMGDFIKSGLVSPMAKNYLGEDFERFMIHYYKALNYLYLNQPDGARVEARRITLSNNTLEDQFKPTSNKYKEDAFSLIVQGLVYESNGESNNAFISYRNAVDLFLNAENRIYYGVALPPTLLQDMYRSAYRSGFTDQIQRYEKKTGIEFRNTETNEAGELVLFIEKGMAPIKADQRFTLTNIGNGSFFFNGPFGGMNIPFDYGFAGWNTSRSISDFSIISVAIPVYLPQNINFESTKIMLNGQSYKSQLVHNISVLAPEILRERMIKEVSAALVRAVIKKATQAVASAAAKTVAENSKSDSKDKKNHGENVAAAAGLLVGLLNTATEKADTRNWQSLPGIIQYIRIPLQKGVNEITLQSFSNEKKITVNSNGGLQLRNWCLLR
jgi:hypothetical protein